MFCKTYSAGTTGLEGFVVEVESDLTKGLPTFSMVGLPAASVRESRERIRSAIQNSGFLFPGKKITINFSPADIRKEGSHFDVAVAVAILREVCLIEEALLENTAFLGELSLDGNLKPIKAMTALLLGLVGHGRIKRVIIPSKNSPEASMVPGLEILTADDLTQVIAFLTSQRSLPQVQKPEASDIDSYAIDFSDLKGTLMAKRAAEIAAAGFHNLYLIGPPGSGKTMIASRIPTILPRLNERQYLQVSRIYSLEGALPETVIARQRPFRAPHHTATFTSLIGGGHNARAGEVVLAHQGVLFLDEFLEFDRKIVEGLRQPIEDRKVTISRLGKKTSYACSFLLALASNPCPCGYKGSFDKACSCSSAKADQYLKKASLPLLDRIDLFAETTPVPYQELVYDSPGESSKDIRKRVEEAHARQKHRFKGEEIDYNSQMDTALIRQYCQVDSASEALLQAAFTNSKLSARGYHRVLRVARSLADLKGSEKIELEHLAEALNFRKVYLKYWG